MVKFIPIDPSEINTDRAGRRGRVSYPIIKGFMELNTKVSKLDLTGLDKNPMYLRSVLQTYINSHNMPIKLFQAGGDLHMMRLDLNNQNEPIEWNPDEQTTEGAAGHERGLDAAPINNAEVEKRFAVEAGKTTK